MAEISEKEMAARKVRKRPGHQVEHFIMRITPGTCTISTIIGDERIFDKFISSLH